MGGLPRPPDALPAQYAVYGTQPLTDYRASSGVGKWATALFWVVCGLGALSIGFAIWQMTAFNQWWDSPTGSVSGMAALDDLLDAEESLEAVRTVFFATALPAAVLLIIYTFQVARHLVRARGATRLRLTEGWAIGGWFVPLANTVLPFLFLSDLDRMSGSDNHPLGTSWRGRSVTGWLWIWWLSIAATLIAGAVRDSVDLDLVDHDGMQTYLSSEIAQQVAVTLAALGMAMYLRRLRRQVDHRAQVHVSPAPPSS